MNWFRSRRNRRVGSYARRRPRRNWWPLIFFIIIVGLFFWAVFQLFVSLFSNVRNEAVSATLSELSGRAEIFLTDGEKWSPAFSGISFVQGDSVRTDSRSRASLTFMEGNTIILGADSELKIETLQQTSSGKKTVAFDLIAGRAWVQVDDTIFQAHEDSLLKLGTDRLELNVRGTTFALDRSEERDVVRLFKGKVDVDVYGAEPESVQNVVVGIGQQLVVEDNTYDLLVQKADLLESVDPDFVESEWHIVNLAQFFPDESESIESRVEARRLLEDASRKADIEASAALDIEDALPLSSDIAAPTITSHSNGQVIPAGTDQIFIKGLAPDQAFQIQVNDYVLQQFEPGDAQWQYIASTNYNTMKPGDNLYRVFAITRDGKRSEAASITLNYAGGFATNTASPEVVETTTPVVTETQAPVASADIDFRAPVVTTPEIFTIDPTGVFETAQSPLTFSGTVPEGTVAVEVNNFRLREFSSGDQTFRYTANAVYGNMKVGDNTYRIVAFGPGGVTSETTIRIVYTPLSVVE